MTPNPPGRNTPRRSRSRRNGEGTIRQRPDGRWEGRIWVMTSDGGEVRRSVYGDTWDDAYAEMTRVKAESIEGIRLPATHQTVGEYVEYWLAEVATHRVRASTMASYRWLARSYIVPYLGTKKLRRLRPSDIRAFLNRLKGVCQCCALRKDAKRVAAGRQARCCALRPAQCCGSFLADGSVRYAHRLVRAILQDAVLEDLVPSNVARNLRISHRYRPKFTPWTAEDARRFLVAVRGDRFYPLYAVALALGLRRGELLALRWVDVDQVDNVVRVEHTLQRINGSLTLGPVKTDGSDRRLAMSNAVAAVFRQQRKAQEVDRLAAGSRWRENGMVFTTKYGTPLEPRNLNRHLDAACKRAGVPRIRFHDLRHSCATLLYDQGVPIENIQDVLGHSSPTVTKTIYVEATRKIQRDAVDRLGFLFDE
jgi:integrase